MLVQVGARALTDIASGGCSGVYSYDNTSLEAECESCRSVLNLDAARWVGMVVCMQA